MTPPPTASAPPRLAPDDRIGREVPPAQILEAAPDAMLVVDEAGIIVYSNSEAEAMFGYDRDAILGRPVEVLVPEARRANHAGQRSMYTANPEARPMGRPLDITARRKDGTEFPADVKLSPLNTPSGLLVTAAIRDMTAPKAAEEQLRTYARHLETLQASIERKNEELRQRNDELTRFAYVSSHDLQEPLRKIVAFGDRLRTRCAGGLDERGLDYLDRMQGAARRMQQLINDLLALSRLTTRGRALGPVDLTAIVAATISDLEVAIERTGGRVDLDALPTIDADALEMRQLFQNLIGNALKFHRPDTPPRVTIQGRLAEAAPDGRVMVEIAVEDNGIGIELKHRERVFEVFERLNPRERYDGTGVGLAICKKIVERHCGTIAVRSPAEGAGTTFAIQLPVTQGSGSGAATPRRREEA